ncbi:hypothetical protein BOX15_Mlig005482g1 [Macrostomum lignano]|uniref:Pinin/SDK/MemA protein domain-containing protein n=1 Tax=Macrostomum lignano TaxID=282301 RepID=A0A267G6L9_9PLAT|nr:hypothetical protein BOX15_Mlig005482g1 [Macrostomum lignano]
MMSENLLQQIQSNLADARSKFKEATESLEKLHGQSKKKLQDRKRGAAIHDSENGTGAIDASGIPAKRAYGAGHTAGSVFQRVAVPSNRQEYSRPAAAAAATATVPLEEFQRARRAAIKEQTASEDSEIKARNRRMFGVMLGTLKQFTAAERDRERQESYQHRREVEQRIEESVKREQEQMQRDITELAREKKRRQAEIVALETQMQLVETHNAWRRSTEQLRGSIRTLADSHPYRLYYRPRQFCDRARRRRELSARQIDAEIADRDRQLREDVERALKEAEAAGEKVALATGKGEEASVVKEANQSKPEPVKRLLSSVAVVPQQQQQQQAAADSAEKPSGSRHNSNSPS